MNAGTGEEPLVLSQEPEGADARFSRFERVQWWQQEKLRAGRVLVVGAGALGNEVIKNLALLGLGQLAIADMDVIEISNLSRSPLFRAADAGKGKAVTAARAALDLYPEMTVYPLPVNVMAALGLGWIRWADVVVGALDNREARVFLNGACARLGRPWIDGGIEVMQGIVRGFFPPETACYECTMGEVDWREIHRRRSCSMLARRALASGGVPTTPITASVIGAIQAQEVVKFLHGLPGLFGRGFLFDGASHGSYALSYPIDPNCPWHDGAPPVEVRADWGTETALDVVFRRAEELLGGCDAIDLPRELVLALECPGCTERTEVMRPVDAISEDEALCPRCGADRVPHYVHSFPRGSEHLAKSPRELGLPAWEVVWARYGEGFRGFELEADAPVPDRGEGR